jgi:hypothetical protein
MHMPAARTLIPLLALLGTLALAAPASAAIAARIDEATAVTLSGTASSIIVGNPSVADVSIIDRHRIAVLGRTYGTTNVMVFDAAGRVIYNGLVTVTSPSAGHVSMFRGASLQNYSCGPRCERTPMPGEASDIYQAYATPYKEYTDRAKPPAGGN